MGENKRISKLDRLNLNQITQDTNFPVEKDGNNYKVSIGDVIQSEVIARTNDILEVKSLIETETSERERVKFLELSS